MLSATSKSGFRNSFVSFKVLGRLTLLEASSLILLTSVRCDKSEWTRSAAETKGKLKQHSRVNTLCYLKWRKIFHLKTVQSKSLLVICCPFQTDNLLDLAAWPSWRCPCSLQGGWARWPPKVPSNPKHSMTWNVMPCFTRINLVKALKNHFSLSHTPDNLNYLDLTVSMEWIPSIG